MKTNIERYLGSKRFGTVKKNYLLSILIKLISLLLFFATPKLILLNVNSDIYGLFIFVLSLGAFFNLLDLGIGNSVRNKITKLNSLNKKNEIKKYVSITYFFLIFLSLILLIFLVIFWNKIEWAILYNSAIKERFEINHIINLFVFFSIFSISLRNINYMLFSFQRSYLVDAMDVLAKLIFFIIILFFYILDVNVQLISLVIIQIISFLLIYIISNIYFFLNYKLSLKFKFYSVVKLYKILFDGIGFFILQVSSVILLFSDKIIVSRFFPASEVTNYFLTGQIYIFQIMFFVFLNQPLWSSFTDAYIKKDKNWIKKTINIEIFILLIFVIFSSLIYLFSKEILELWVGNNIKFDQSLSFYWLIFVILRSGNIIFTNFLNGANILKIQIFIAISIAIINIPISIYLAVKLDMGSKGVLIGTIICIAFSLILKSFYTVLNINRINK
jgi:O-antigen/teichoic acid export membrane protein